MKKALLFTSLLFFCAFANAQKTFEDVLSAAAYAKKHIRQAFIVNNIEHSHQYAEKAIEALLEVERLTDLYGCYDSNSLAYDARDNMESSIEQDTWERSRFYAKRAEKIATELLVELNKCDIKTNFTTSSDTQEESTSSEGASTTTATKTSTAIESAQAAIQQHQNEMDRQRAELLRKQQELEAQQKRLAEEIELQKQKQAKLEAKRAAELKQQQIVQQKAQEALLKLEAVLEELSLIFDKRSMFASDKRYIRSEEILQAETLRQTKSFYAKQAKRLSETGIKQFSNYIKD